MYIYIIGRGHSGSTVVDCLLDNCQQVQGCGEMAAGLPRLVKNELELNNFCKDFWNNVRREYQTISDRDWEDDMIQIGRFSKITNLPSVILDHVCPKSVGKVYEMKQINQTLLASIKEVSSKRLIVDSSKEITRGLLLVSQRKAKAIHLIRNPLSIMASTLHRLRHMHGFRFLRKNYKEKYMEPVFMALCVIGWLVGNMIIDIIKLFHDDKFVTIRYEDLACDYEKTLSDVGRHTNLNVEEITSRIENQNNIHIGCQVSGNKLLQKNEFVFNTDRPTRTLPTPYKVLGIVLSFPLALKYGYMNHE